MATCSRLGRIEYSPRPLFKVVLYGSTRGIYATREIERACRENINFMHLLERRRAPDHDTIAHFHPLFACYLPSPKKNTASIPGPTWAPVSGSCMERISSLGGAI